MVVVLPSPKRVYPSLWLSPSLLLPSSSWLWSSSYIDTFGDLVGSIPNPNLRARVRAIPTVRQSASFKAKQIARRVACCPPPRYGEKSPSKPQHRGDPAYRDPLTLGTSVPHQCWKPYTQRPIPLGLFQLVTTATLPRRRGTWSSCLGTTI